MSTTVDLRQAVVLIRLPAGQSQGSGHHMPYVRVTVSTRSGKRYLAGPALAAAIELVASRAHAYAVAPVLLARHGTAGETGHARHALRAQPAAHLALAR